MKAPSRFWADLTARDAAGLDGGRVVAVLPIGAIEQHGPHLPLAVDQAILDGIIAAALAHIPDDCPALFLPTLPYGKSNEHVRFAGTLTLSARTLLAVGMEIGASVARAGVRRLVLLNSHGGQIPVLDILARDLRVEHDMLVVAANWFAMGLPDGLFTEEEQRHGIHAGDMETSLMLALHPDLVDMGHARDFRPATMRLAEENALLGLSPSGKLGWMAQDLHPAGACGNAAAATAEKGRAVLDHAARQLARLLVEVAAAPLSLVETQADPDAAS